LVLRTPHVGSSAELRVAYYLRLTSLIADALAAYPLHSTPGGGEEEQMWEFLRGLDEGWVTVLMGLPWPHEGGEQGEKMRRTEVVRLQSILGEIREVVGEKLGGEEVRERVDVRTGEVVRDYQEEEGVQEMIEEEEEEEEETPRLEEGDGSVTTTTETEGMDIDTTGDEGDDAEDSDDDAEFDEVLPLPRMSIPPTTSYDISFADPLPITQEREVTFQYAFDPDEEYGSDEGETELDKLFSRTLLILEVY
jgi:hypothetical protein